MRERENYFVRELSQGKRKANRLMPEGKVIVTNMLRYANNGKIPNIFVKRLVIVGFYMPLNY